MYIYICINIYIYIYIYIYIFIVCDYEITHTSYAICRDKIYINFMAPFCGLGTTASRLDRAL